MGKRKGERDKQGEKQGVKQGGKPAKAGPIFPKLPRPLLAPRPAGVGSNVGGLGGIGSIGGPAGKLNPLGPAKPAGGGYTGQSYELPADHGWKCAPGHKIFVANRGDVRFEFPDGFVNTHDERAIKLHDKPPPDDDCRISVTIFPVPPEVGAQMLKDLPLDKLLSDAARDDVKDEDLPEGMKAEDRPRRAEPPGHVTLGRRLNYEYGWLQYAWHDDEDGNGGRIVQARTLMARTARVHMLITFEFYKDRAEAFEPVFDHLLKTLRLAEPVTLTMRQGMN